MRILRAVSAALVMATVTSACRLVLSASEGEIGLGDAASPADAEVEDCGNGRDDDGNGLADCADPRCAAEGYRCIAPPDTLLFSDVAHVIEGAEAGSLAACAPPFVSATDGIGGAYAQRFGGALDAPPACTPCVCSIDGGCVGAGVQLFSDDACTQLVDTQGPSATCESAKGISLAERRSASLLRGVVQAPQCIARSSIPVQARWGKVVRVCTARSLSQSGCAASQVCVPPPTIGARPAICVLSKGRGVAPCPPSFPAREILYQGVDDARTCSMCSCGSPQDVTCTSRLRGRRFSQGRCDANDDVVDTSGQCQRLPQALGKPEMRFVIDLTLQGTCTPVSGGVAGGTAVPGPPETLCCTE